MIRGHDGPAAWRLWNLNHLWGRLRDFYQVRGQEGEAEPGSPLSAGRPFSHLPPRLPSAAGGAAAADPVSTPRPPGAGV